MNNIYSKLRSKNIKNYYMLIFCTILSVVLITSYAVMFFSPTVQSVFPKGGDSRKQASLIFGIAVIGCSLFTTYASSLFFKYKSQETGILLSLGARKSQIKKVLFNELSFITSISSLIGLVISVPVSFGIWKLFQVFIVDTKEMTYKLGWSGILFGVAFCIFVTLCIFAEGIKFIRRTNIMEIINEHRKCESVKDVKPWYGIIGSILSIVGILLGYAIPELTVYCFDYHMPSIWELTYLVSAVGIYMLMTYVIIHNKKGKNPQKYYKNIISNSMMKLMGKQTVKSMCIISLLVIGGLFSAFYLPSTSTSVFYYIKNNPIDYSFYYKGSENQITKDEIYSLAKKYNVNITSFNEAQSISLIGDDKSYGEFFSESDFNKVSGQNVDVKTGEYLIINGLFDEGGESRFSYINKIRHPVTYVSEELKYVGKACFQPFFKRGATKYVISDEDYKKYIKKLPKENFENFVLFNVKNPYETYAFSNELKNEIIKRSSKDVAVPMDYDDYEKKVYNRRGEKYWADGRRLELSVDNSALLSRDWKYYPSFKVLDRQDYLKNLAVFVMLFIYITIICFTAIAIIAYTRSLTIAINNKTLFDDLKKLGANRKYIENCIKVQLKKLFTIPTIVGSVIMYLFYFLIFYGNSGGSIDTSEYIALAINLGVVLIAGLFVYIIYKLSLKKVKKIIEI